MLVAVLHRLLIATVLHRMHPRHCVLRVVLAGLLQFRNKSVDLRPLLEGLPQCIPADHHPSLLSLVFCGKSCLLLAQQKERKEAPVPLSASIHERSTRATGSFCLVQQFGADEQLGTIQMTITSLCHDLGVPIGDGDGERRRYWNRLYNS